MFTSVYGIAFLQLSGEVCLVFLLLIINYYCSKQRSQDAWISHENIKYSKVLLQGVFNSCLNQPLSHFLVDITCK
jgi:hypothetical protein